MTKVGDLRSDQPPLEQTVLRTTIGQAYVTNAAATFDLGSFTPSVDGTVIAMAFIHCQWANNIQEVTFHLGPSTPAPPVNCGSNFTENGLPDKTITAYGHAWAMWTGATAGTPIALKLAIAIGVYAPTVTVNRATTIIRAHRIG
jgi:hypothetical protein